MSTTLPLLLRIALATATASCAVSGWAQPSGEPARTAPQQQAAELSDPLLQLLQKRGLVDKVAAQPAVTFIQQFRDVASDMVISAMNFLGVHYQRGGNGMAGQGFDCSGFTRHIFENSIGLVLPRRSDDQAKDKSLKAVAKEELRPGDLVFFNTLKQAFSHVGIYIGEGKFIHSPRSGGQVRIEDMRMAYWTTRFDGARRAKVLAAPTTAASPADAASAPAKAADLAGK